MALKPNQLKAIGLIKFDPDISKAELARQVGVTEKTIYNWFENAEFREVLQQAPEQMVKSALFLKAINGDTGAMEKWIKWYGEEHRREHKDDFAEALEFTSADYKKIAKDAHEWYAANTTDSRRGTGEMIEAAVH